jgi:tRNA dimethylallyltransferase
MGPTASGKTDLAIELAGRLDCELVSVDSALVYRGMDIGSAKPDYPHHLVDIRDPLEAYSAADFAQDAQDLVREISARGRTPLLVGGTMLYFRAFLEGLAQMPAADPGIRAAIEAEAVAHGWPALHAQLAQVDPDAAARIHPNHSRRISRALEVYRASGVPLTQWHRRGGDSSRFDPFTHYRVVQLCVCPEDRAVLYERIERRFGLMLQAGFLEEVGRLYRRGDLDPGLPALRAVGYRQLWRHLDGQCSLEEAVREGIAATRQLAKRQLTWLRKWRDLAWIYTDKEGNVAKKSLNAEKGADVGGAPVETALNYLDLAQI